MSKASWCDYGEAASQVEKKEKDALEVGPQAHAAEDA